MTIVVVAALIERDGRFLVTRRQTGVHLEGLWEFPGGKIERGEDLAAALAREIREELGVGARLGEEVFVTTHEYADRSVELHFLRCALLGDPTPQMGQQLRWATPAELQQLDFPRADTELIARLTA